MKYDMGVRPAMPAWPAGHISFLRGLGRHMDPGGGRGEDVPGPPTFAAIVDRVTSGAVRNEFTLLSVTRFVSGVLG